MAFQETKWSNQTKQAVKVPNFNPLQVFRTDRKTPRGGTAILAAQHMNITNREDLNTEKWIQSTVVELSDFGIIVASVYNPRHTKLLQHYIKFIAGMARWENKKLIIL